MTRSVLSRFALCAALALAAASPMLSPAPAAAQTSCASVWRVAPGDTLARIARTCGIPSAAIRAANPGVDWNRLPVGTPIRLDGRGGGSGTAGRPEAYIVRPGDTLSSIARSFGIPLQALLDANPNLSDRDLQVGREIRFGGGGGAARPNPQRPGAEGRRVEVEVDERNAVPGGTVVFRLAGLPANRDIVVATNPGPGFAGTDVRARAGSRGLATVELTLPRSARPGERWRYEVLDEAMRPIASGAYRIVAPRAQPGRPGRPGLVERVRVSGVISNEGATCPALRGDDGRLYTLAGDIGGWRGGDRVEVTGEIAQMSVCMQGTTIAVATIRAAR